MKTAIITIALAIFCAPAPAMAALNNQYVSYTFSAYPDKADPYFPTFTLYAGDFIADPDPAAFSATRFYSANNLVNSNNVASVSIEWGGMPCCGMATRPSYLTIYQRFAYPGQNRFGGFVPVGVPITFGNGRFIWTVALVDGAMPSFTPQITALTPFNGAWETAIGSTQQIDPTVIPPSAVPEPGVWGMMIAGFGLVGVRMRRKNRIVTLVA